MVLQHLAKGDVPQEVIFKMQSGAEAIEGIIHKNKFTERFFNKPISELPLPESCVIAAVIRGDRNLYAFKRSCLLKPDDRIIVFILEQNR